MLTRRKVLAASATRGGARRRRPDRGGRRDRLRAGRGDLSTLDRGWQKFVGRELRAGRAARRSSGRWSWTRRSSRSTAIASSMCLPFARDRLFVEDTYYSDTPELDAAALRRADRRLCRRARAGRSPRSMREETGRAAGRDRRRFRGLLAVGRQRASPRPGCAPGCSTRPPAIRCPMRCGPPMLIADAERPVGRGAARADLRDYARGGMGSARLLPHARRDAVPRRRARRALPGARTLLPPGRRR